MENELNPELELENENEGGEGDGKGALKPKPELTPEQILGIKKRNFTKLAKELGVELPKSESEKPKKQEEGFDYGRLGFLESKGISHGEDQNWVFERTKEMGIELRDFMGKDWVQKELKERKDARATDGGIPEGTRRSKGGASEDSVEYYVASGKQPPAEKGLEFRKKVLQARLKHHGDDNKFSKDSLISPFS